MTKSTANAAKNRENAYPRCEIGVAAMSRLILRSKSPSTGMPHATAAKNGKISANNAASANARLKAELIAIFTPPVSALPVLT